MNKYVTILGDTWDMIAHKVYGDSLKVNELVNANLHLIETVIFSAGVEVNIPALEEQTTTPKPPWMVD